MDAISADHENAGIMSRDMPGARDVRIVVATERLAAKRPTMRSPTPIRNKSPMSALPPFGPPFAMREINTRPDPKNQAQNPYCAKRGNAIAFDPTCIGTIAIARPMKSGASKPRTRTWRNNHESCNAASPSKICMLDGLIRSKPKMVPRTATSNA